MRAGAAELLAPQLSPPSLFARSEGMLWLGYGSQHRCARRPRAAYVSTYALDSLWKYARQRDALPELPAAGERCASARVCVPRTRARARAGAAVLAAAAATMCHHHAGQPAIFSNWLLGLHHH